MQAIITMAGKSERFKDYGFEKPKFLINILGKTILEYSIDSLPLKYLDKINFVMLKEHSKTYNVQEIIRELLQKKEIKQGLEILFTEIDEVTRGQSETAFLGTDKLDPDKPLLIYNIDTYFKIDYDELLSNVNRYHGIILGSPRDGFKWSFAVVDDFGYVSEVAEKNRISNNALVGAYFFRDVKMFISLYNKQIEENIIVNGEFYIAPLYNLLIQGYRVIKYEEVQEFVPLGTPDEVFDFLRKNSTRTKERSFNKIEIDLENQVLKKSSKNKKKLSAEYNWLKQANKNEVLQRFTPKIYVRDWEDDEILMEYVPFPSLSETFLFSSFKENEVDKIFEKLFYYLDETKIMFHPPNEVKHNRENLIKHKTLDRLSEYFGTFFIDEQLQINGKFIDLKIDIEDLIDDILNNRCIPAIFHGDLCFPNILFDVKNVQMKLIDPRGEFFGDMYYDLAKLRHSLSGYDLIVNGFYSLEQNSSHVVEYDIFWNNNFNKKNLEKFDTLLVKKGFDLKQVKMIESILFLTMIPLHDEDPKRQRMFYILAIEKINELL